MTLLFDPTPYLELERESVAAGVAPLLHGVETASNGDKIAHSQSVEVVTAGSVATVAPVAGGVGLIDPLPGHWRAALSKLSRARRPGSKARWDEINADALALAMRWGPTADALGWDIVSVFGYHLEYDDVGLVLQMRGRQVVAMTAGADGKPAEAVIQTGPRSWHICRARVPLGTALLWRWEEADTEPI